jgi:hypothetical protein
VCAVKEALNNILKHADATQVRVTVNTRHDFEVAIHHNGHGFAIEEPVDTGVNSSWGSSTRGRGLLTMENRLRRVQGRCRIEGQPGQGTRVLFSLPLHRGEASGVRSHPGVRWLAMPCAGAPDAADKGIEARTTGGPWVPDDPAFEGSAFTERLSW